MLESVENTMNNLSMLVQVGVLLVGIVGVYYGLKGKVDIILVRLTSLETGFKSIQTMLTNSAVQDQRISNLEEDFRELRKGRGFIQREINGEWPRGE